MVHLQNPRMNTATIILSMKIICFEILSMTQISQKNLWTFQHIPWDIKELCTKINQTYQLIIILKLHKLKEIVFHNFEKSQIICIQFT